MSAVKPKRSVAKEVTAKASSGQCLICGKPARGNRGLCVSHYLKFYRTMMSLPEQKRVEFEQRQIQAGRILAAGAIREIKEPNPFLSESSDD